MLVAVKQTGRGSWWAIAAIVSQREVNLYQQNELKWWGTQGALPRDSVW
jgi:hypothetical protein